MFQQHQGFQVPVQEHPRRARLAASEVVLQPSARIDSQRMMESRSAQLDNEQ